MGKFIALPNYPTSAWGATKVTSGDFFGTNNYQAGGETVVPGSFGFGGIEKFEMSGYAVSNNYFARAAYPANSFSANESYASTFGQGPSSANNTNAPVVKWFTAANSVEVANNTNLAAECVRLSVFGV